MQNKICSEKPVIPKKCGNSLLIRTDSFVAVDVETTGGCPDSDRIIEIGAAKYEHGRLVETFSQLINPGFPVTTFISELTGITNEMLSSAGDEYGAVSGFLSFIGGGETVLLAHNARFDIGFLTHAVYRNFREYLENDFIDTLRIARRTVKGLPNYRLCTLVDHLGVDAGGFHRALSDAKMAGDCYLKMAVKLL